MAVKRQHGTQMFEGSEHQEGSGILNAKKDFVFFFLFLRAVGEALSSTSGKLEPSALEPWCISHPKRALKCQKYWARLQLALEELLSIRQAHVAGGLNFLDVIHCLPPPSAFFLKKKKNGISMTLNLQEGRFGIKELKNSYLILYSLLQWETTNCHNTGVITYANEHLHQRLYLEDGDGSSDLWSFFRKENSSVL